MRSIIVIVAIVLILSSMGWALFGSLLAFTGLVILGVVLVRHLSHDDRIQDDKRIFNTSHTHGSELPFARQQTTVRQLADSVPNSGLIIKPEPLHRILSRQKTWEMRSLTTTKRETIALIERGGRRILGIARIADVLGPLDKDTMRSTVHLHGIEASRLDNPEVAKLRYAWVLDDVVSLKVPVSYEPRLGAVRFISLNEEEREAIRRALM